VKDRRESSTGSLASLALASPLYVGSLHSAPRCGEDAFVASIRWASRSNRSSEAGADRRPPRRLSDPARSKRSRRCLDNTRLALGRCRSTCLEIVPRTIVVRRSTACFRSGQAVNESNWVIGTSGFKPRLPLEHPPHGVLFEPNQFVPLSCLASRSIAVAFCSGATVHYPCRP